MARLQPPFFTLLCVLPEGVCLFVIQGTDMYTKDKVHVLLTFVFCFLFFFFT